MALPGGSGTSGRAARRGALVGWGVAFPISLGAAISVGPKWGSSAGMPVALGLHVPWSLAILAASLAGLAVAAVGIQLGGACIGWVVGRAIDRWRGRAPDPATGSLGWRDRLGIALWLLPQGFPISLLYATALPAIWSWVGRVEDRNRAAAWLWRGLYLVFFCAGMFALYRWAPFFTAGHAALLAGFPIAAAVLFAARPGRRTLLGLAAALALTRALWPPLDLSISLRLVVAGLLAVVAGLPAGLLSDPVARRMTWVPVFSSFLVLGLFAHFAILFILPSPGSVERIEARPGVRVEVPLPGPAAFSENRFYVDGCGAGDRYFGSRETWHGLSRPFPPLSPVPSLPIDSGNNMILDCERGEGWLGDYARGVIHRIDLGSFRILPEAIARGSEGPTMIQRGSFGRAVYAMDDSGAVQAYDVETGSEVGRWRECVVNGFFADEPRGTLYAASCGFLYAFPLSGEDAVDKLDLRVGFTLPFPFETHFHRVTADPEGGRLYVTYAEIGAVFRVAVAPLRIEQVLRLETGGRDALYDSLSDLLFVGNYATGNLVVIEPETMEVLDRIFVGKRIRNITRSPHGPRLTLTSAAGGIGIDLTTVIGDRVRERGHGQG